MEKKVKLYELILGHNVRKSVKNIKVKVIKKLKLIDVNKSYQKQAHTKTFVGDNEDVMI